MSPPGRDVVAAAFVAQLMGGCFFELLRAVAISPGAASKAHERD